MASLLAAHLDMLVCPVCHAGLALTLLSVDCIGCGRIYPIVDGLPVLIASRANLQEKALTAGGDSASKPK
jgi:uncharacterized protein YbaR (Trm112 family)